MIFSRCAGAAVGEELGEDLVDAKARLRQMRGTDAASSAITNTRGHQFAPAPFHTTDVPRYTSKVEGSSHGVFQAVLDLKQRDRSRRAGPPLAVPF